MNAMTRKVVGDLRERPSRSILVSAGIALSVALVVGASVATSVLTRELAASFIRSQPSHIVLIGAHVSDADDRLYRVLME